MSEPKYLIVFPDCLVAPGCKTVGSWTLSRVTGKVLSSIQLLRFVLPGTRTGVIFSELGDFMNQRTLVPSLLFILLVSPFWTAQQTPDSSNNRLATILHLLTLTSH